jgi:hypothetical protein
MNKDFLAQADIVASKSAVIDLQIDGAVRPAAMLSV